MSALNLLGVNSKSSFRKKCFHGDFYMQSWERQCFDLYTRPHWSSIFEIGSSNWDNLVSDPFAVVANFKRFDLCQNSSQYSFETLGYPRYPKPRRGKRTE